jgi:hypothetical protein
MMPKRRDLSATALAKSRAGKTYHRVGQSTKNVLSASRGFAQDFTQHARLHITSMILHTALSQTLR